MIRQTIVQLQSNEIDSQDDLKSIKKYDDKYIFMIVRQLILKSLRRMIPGLQD